MRKRYDKKNLIGLLWGESSFKICSILYGSVITAFLLQIGLKNSQIGILWSLVLFSQMLFDYPTGGFADKYGRLKIFTIGMIFMGISILIIASGNVSILYFGAILLGIGESQVSGTLFPWFVNTFEEEEMTDFLKKENIIKANAQTQYVTNILGIFIGFFIASFSIDYKTILMSAGILHILNGILIYVIFPDNKSSESSLMKIGKKSLSIFLEDPKLWTYTLGMSLHYTFHSVYLFIWQPSANSLGIFGSKLGAIQSLYLACLALSALVVKFVKIKSYIFYLLSSISIPISLLLIYHSNNLFLYLTSMIFLGLSNGIMIPLIMGSVHFFIVDDFRSSVISLMSSLSSIFLVFVQIVIGKILDNNVRSYLEIFSLVCGIAYVLCIFFIRNWSIQHEKENSGN